MNRIIRESIINRIKEIIPEGIHLNVNISAISRWKIGGNADCIVRPGSTSKVAELISYLSVNSLPYLVIGSTSNLLFSDKGVRAVIIQIGDRMADYKVTGNSVWVQAGKWMPGFARNVAQAGLSGIEHTAGIPGTIGGLICMNGGSQRKGIGSHIKTVTAVSPEGNIEAFSNEECKFAYRSSIFQENGYVITEAELEFSERRTYDEIRNEMLDILRARRAKFPQKLPNCGSTFISNPDIYKKYGPPGKVIEDLGLKGYRIGGAEVSAVHANFINNLGDAKADDIRSLIRMIYKKVKRKTGFEMIAEVKVVMESGQIIKATEGL